MEIILAIILFIVLEIVIFCMIILCKKYDVNFDKKIADYMYNHMSFPRELLKSDKKFWMLKNY